MINDDDLVKLAEDCIKICEVLRVGIKIKGKNADDLSNLVRTAITDLEECAHLPYSSVGRNNGVFPGQRTTLNGWSRNTPKEIRSLGCFIPSTIRRRSKGGGRRYIRFLVCSV